MRPEMFVMDHLLAFVSGVYHSLVLLNATPVAPFFFSFTFEEEEEKETR